MGPGPQQLLRHAGPRRRGPRGHHRTLGRHGLGRAGRTPARRPRHRGAERARAAEGRHGLAPSAQGGEAAAGGRSVPGKPAVLDVARRRRPGTAGGDRPRAPAFAPDDRDGAGTRPGRAGELLRGRPDDALSPLPGGGRGRTLRRRAAANAVRGQLRADLPSAQHAAAAGAGRHPVLLPQDRRGRERDEAQQRDPVPVRQDGGPLPVMERLPCLRGAGAGACAARGDAGWRDVPERRAGPWAEAAATICPGPGQWLSCSAARRRTLRRRCTRQAWTCGMAAPPSRSDPAAAPASVAIAATGLSRRSVMRWTSAAGNAGWCLTRSADAAAPGPARRRNSFKPPASNAWAALAPRLAPLR